jgi:ParB-like chromosome segregation protein Spo0J
MTTPTTRDLNADLKSIAKNSATPAAADQFEFEFHPLANKFPLMEGDDLFKLADDILVNGLHEPITLYQGKILDGRNRYRACKELKTFKFVPAHFRELPSGLDPLAFVISANIHRRHLTAEQKRDLLATLIMSDPSKSNRQIAEQAKVSHHTVGEVREGLEATGQLAQLGATTGKDGKKRKTKGKGGGGRKRKASEKVMITYAQVTDARTAINAYSVLEQHLLDALQDLNDHSSFAHADEYAQKTIEKLQEKLSGLQEKKEEEEQDAA